MRGGGGGPRRKKRTQLEGDGEVGQQKKTMERKRGGIEGEDVISTDHDEDDIDPELREGINNIM